MKRESGLSILPDVSIQAGPLNSQGKFHNRLKLEDFSSRASIPNLSVCSLLCKGVAPHSTDKVNELSRSSLLG